MRKKETWMKVGAIVMADGKPGTITKMEENTLNGQEYVYYIHVRRVGVKWDAPYHPNDVSELKEEEVKP
jgi:hypothetical protein